jgi:hypothetical protein
MLKLGEFKLVDPSFTLEALENENFILKKQKGQLGTIIVLVLIAGAYFAFKYYETRMKLKRTQTPIIIRPNKKP